VGKNLCPKQLRYPRRKFGPLELARVPPIE
jgi:hypothetical protein